VDDIASLTLDELRRRARAAIARRLEALSAEDRARAGDELLRVLDELHRRGYRPYSWYGLPAGAPPERLAEHAHAMEQVRHLS
jgi:hypothetical protein